MRSSVAGEPAERAAPATARYSVSCMSRAGCSARHVERFEVVLVVLDLGAFDDLEAHAREDGLDAARAGCVSGWRWPSGGARPGSVTSTAPAGRPRPRRPLRARSSSRASMSLLQLVGVAGRARGRSSAGADAERLHAAPRRAPSLRAEVAVAERLAVAARLAAARGRARTAARSAMRSADWSGARIDADVMLTELDDARRSRAVGSRRAPSWHASLRASSRALRRARQRLGVGLRPARPASRTPPAA